MVRWTAGAAAALLLALGSSGCGPALCGGVACAANAECVSAEGGETCRCAAGYVERGGRCQPEGPCGKLAGVLCLAVGQDPGACAALRAGVVTADGAACERRLGEANLQEDVAWLGEVEPMLARELPAAYRGYLTRSLLDPCGAAQELLCMVLRPGQPECRSTPAAELRSEGSCRQALRTYDQALAGTAAGGPPTAPGEPGTETFGDVLVHLIPDPANVGRLPPAQFRQALLALRADIEACDRGARESFPGLSGRAVYQVRVEADGAVTVELGRADGPIVGAGVADCVRDTLDRLDFSEAPPEGGPFVVHVSFDFGR
ncbi:MAG: hypothetical protein JXB32_18835 [Deltaproteobacteria bacterium]|nr:hypothetical protein [Deltaproteobacteria bacterium]